MNAEDIASQTSVVFETQCRTLTMSTKLTYVIATANMHISILLHNVRTHLLISLESIIDV